MHGARLGLLGVVLLVGSACSSSPDEEKFSDHYRVDELNASLGAFADEERLKVYAALLGKKGFVRLRGGDTIEVVINGEKVPTIERLLGDRIHYIADVPAPPPETEVTVSLVRGLERAAGTIRLYSEFSIVEAPSELKLGESAEVDIDPRPDLSEWPGFFGPGLIAKAEIIGDCLETGVQQLSLCGVASESEKCTQGYPMKLDFSELLPLPNSKGCDLTVQVRLTTRGSLEKRDDATSSFKGGNFEGYRLNTFTMRLSP